VPENPSQGFALGTAIDRENRMPFLTDIAFELDADFLLKQMCLSPNTPDADEFHALLSTARERAKPKAAYRECYIEDRTDDTVTIDGSVFKSRLLSRNLSEVQRVFPFVVTCGKELDQISFRDDMLKDYWWEAIKAEVLTSARSFLKNELEKRFRLGHTSAMSPGSGDVHIWPIEEQRPLFRLLGDVTSAIGVELTPSFLMLPVKSLSGIRFQTEVDFRSCQVCRRKDCPLRSAPFDRALWEDCRH
jgi:hypothetical protein